MSSGILVHPDAKIGARFAPAPFSVIDENVVIGDDVTVGSFVHICAGAHVGAGTIIGDSVTISADAKIGAKCLVSDFAVIGRRPRLAPTSTAKTGDLKGVSLGEGCTVGSHTVVMAGSKFGAGCVIGDNAGVRERCRIGENVVIGRSVTVENDTEIGSRTKIQSGAYITAYVVIEQDCFIAPMVVTTNDNFMGRTQERFRKLKGCTIRRGARVGGGSHILPGIEIGEEAFVATGSVVTRDVPAGKLVMGVPAKVVRDVPPEELLDNQ